MPSARRNRRIRRLSYLILMVLLIAALSGGILSWWGGVWLRSLVEREVQHYLVPRVMLSSPLRWRLWPSPAITLHDFALLDEDDGILLSVKEAAFAPDFRELMKGRLALHAIEISGVTLALERLADGAWNVMRWLRAEEGAASDDAGGVPPIHRVRVRDMTIQAAAPWRAVVEMPLLEAGPVMPGTPGNLAAHIRLRFPPPLENGQKIPADDSPFAGLNVAAGFLWQADVFEFDTVSAITSGEWVAANGWRLSRGELLLGQLRAGFDGAIAANDFTFNAAAGMPDAAMISEAALSAEFSALSGQGTDWRLAMPLIQVNGHYQQQEMTARLSAPAMVSDETGWQVADLSLAMETVVAGAAGKFDAAAVAKGDWSGDSSDIFVTLKQGRFAAPHPADEGQTLFINVEGDMRFDPDSGSGSGELRGDAEQSRFEGQWHVDLHEPAPLAIVLSVDRLDAERYLPQQDAMEKTEAPADLTAWRQLPVDIDIHVGELRWRDFTAHDTRVEFSRSGVPMP